MTDEFWRQATRWPQHRGQLAWREPFAYHVVLLVRELDEARPDHNEPITDVKIEAIGELLRAFDLLRQEWLP